MNTLESRRLWRTRRVAFPLLSTALILSGGLLSSATLSAQTGPRLIGTETCAYDWTQKKWVSTMVGTSAFDPNDDRIWVAGNAYKVGGASQGHENIDYRLRRTPGRQEVQTFSDGSFTVRWSWAPYLLSGFDFYGVWRDWSSMDTAYNRSAYIRSYPFINLQQGPAGSTGPGAAANKIKNKRLNVSWNYSYGCSSTFPKAKEYDPIKQEMVYARYNIAADLYLYDPDRPDLWRDGYFDSKNVWHPGAFVNDKAIRVMIWTVYNRTGLTDAPVYTVSGQRWHHYYMRNSGEPTWYFIRETENADEMSVDLYAFLRAMNSTYLGGKKIVSDNTYFQKFTFGIEIGEGTQWWFHAGKPALWLSSL